LSKTKKAEKEFQELTEPLELAVPALVVAVDVNDLLNNGRSEVEVFDLLGKLKDLFI